MSLTGLSSQEIEQYEKTLLDGVPDTGSIGNIALFEKLSSSDEAWTNDLFWAIRNRLIDEHGKLLRGRGKGGSVRRVPPIATPDRSVEPAPPQFENGNPSTDEDQTERDLYEPMLDVIKKDWSLEAGLKAVVAEITAQGGRRRDGKWSRPDITLASYRVFPYVAGRHFDLITFEIKSYNAIDITVIYEALAHRRAATRAYTIVHIPSERRSELAETLDEICEEAKRIGIGVIVAENPNDYKTWEELVEALRHEPDPQRLNDFLSKQVSQGFREQIITWFR